MGRYPRPFCVLPVFLVAVVVRTARIGRVIVVSQKISYGKNAHSVLRNIFVRVLVFFTILQQQPYSVFIDDIHHGIFLGGKEPCERVIVLMNWPPS